jgi:hypothetical protein
MFSPTRNRSPSFTDCSNPIDPITQYPFTEEDDILFIRFNDQWHCFNKEMCLLFLNQPGSRMAYWVGGDSVGYGGRPDLNQLVYKFPDGVTWVDSESKFILQNTRHIYFDKILVAANVPIGNVQGQMGVSMLHGNNPQNIYRLQPLFMTEEEEKEFLNERDRTEFQMDFEAFPADPNEQGEEQIINNNNAFENEIREFIFLVPRSRSLHQWWEEVGEYVAEGALNLPYISNLLDNLTFDETLHRALEDENPFLLWGITFRLGELSVQHMKTIILQEIQRGRMYNVYALVRLYSGRRQLDSESIYLALLNYLISEDAIQSLQDVDYSDMRELVYYYISREPLYIWRDGAEFARSMEPYVRYVYEGELQANRSALRSILSHLLPQDIDSFYQDRYGDPEFGEVDLEDIDENDFQDDDDDED